MKLVLAAAALLLGHSVQAQEQRDRASHQKQKQGYVCDINRVHDIYIQESLGAPDGGVERVLVTSNGTIPGAEIRSKVGDCVKVNVHNQLSTEGVSIHYHGIEQKGSPWEDGAAHVTECPGVPKATVSHVFKVDQAGTFFYHSHIGNQVTDGVYGAFIVEDKPDEEDESSGKVCFPPGSSLCASTDAFADVNLVVSDWWTVDSRAQEAGLNRPAFKWIGDPQAVLINGVSSPNQNGTYTIEVTRGTTYRMRLICASALSYIRWGIEGHSMTIIAADGYYLKEPLETDYVDCSNGQRYDVLLKADAPKDDGKNGLYWMYAHSRYRAVTVAGAARIIYSDAPNSDPATAVPSSNFTALIAQTPPSAGPDAFVAGQAAVDFDKKKLGTKPLPEGEPNQKFTFYMSQQRMSLDGRKTYTPYNAANKSFDILPGADTAYLKWAINDISYYKEDTPVLLAAYTKLYKDDYQPHPGTYELDEGDYVQVILQSGVSQGLVFDQHPWHLHGHSFWVVGSGMGDYNKDTDPAKFNLKDPAYRDTVSVYPSGWAAIRFKADNVGAWAFHCHVSSHFAPMGMGVVFLTSRYSIPSPPPGYQVCGRVAPDTKKVKTNQGYYADHEGQY